MSVNFDFNINDQNKVLILVKNLLQDKSFESKSHECDIFDESECHHLPNHHLNYDLNHLKSLPKCSYCQFYDLLKEKHSSIRIINDLFRTTNLNKHYVNMKYKKNDYQLENLDWAEFQPWRSPHALMAYALCYNQVDIYNAIKNFDKEKLKYKKTLVSSKLFIDLHLKHEMSEEFQKSLVLNNSSDSSFHFSLEASDLNRLSTSDMISIKNSNFDFDSDSLFDSNNNNIKDPDTNSINFTNNLDLKIENGSRLDYHRNISIIKSEDKFSEAKNQNDEIEIDQNELNIKLKSLEKDLIYLDFLFARNGVEKIAVILETEKTKIQCALEDSLDQIFKKIVNLSKTINPNDNNQLNYYSEFLKSPIERNPTERVKTSDSTLTSSSFLSIRMIDKKIVSGRMYKFKADLLLMLNLIEPSLYLYYQSFNLLKKENDVLWFNSSLEGLCVASYLYMLENNLISTKKISNDPSLSSNSEMTTSFTKTKTLKELSTSLKKNFLSSSVKEINQVLVQLIDFAKNYNQIIIGYYKNEQTKFISIEVALMISNFFIQNNMKNESMYFINHAIYITNSQISEEAKIRRYLEIGNLYEKCEMNHLATLYKWVSAGRIFRITDKIKDYEHSTYFKCLLKRCIQQLINLFNDLKINQQKYFFSTNSNESKIVQSGFPTAKKHIIVQVIQLSRFDNNIYQAIKFIKYLIHEMFSYLSKEELKFYIDYLVYKMEHDTNDELETRVDDIYYTKFYKFPILNLFQVKNHKSDLNRTTNILDTSMSSNPNSIYIYRYENKLFQNKKRTIYKLPVNHPNKIEIELSNPLPIDLLIDYINLLAEFEDKDNNEISKFSIELFNSIDSGNKEINLKAGIKNHKLQMEFIYNELISFKIIGYEIKSLKCKNKILFSEISCGTTHTPKNGRVENLIDTIYEIEMVTKLPLIKNLRLISDNILEPIFNINEAKYLNINADLGSKENFLIKFILEFPEELDIINIKLNILNEQNANRLNCKVSIRNENNNYYLEIDSSNFCSDSIVTESDLDLSASLEVRYTNQTGRERNLCNIFKIQLAIKFIQMFNIKLLNVNEIDENKFECKFLVKNLLEQNLYLHINNHEKVTIEKLETYEFKKFFNKFQLLDLINNNDCENHNMVTLDLLNSCLNIEVSKFEDENNNKYSSLLKFNSKITDLESYLSKFYKYPFDLIANVKKNNLETESINIYSIMFIILNKNESKFSNSDYYFKVKITDKLKLFSITNNFQWTLKDLKTNYWSKELRFWLIRTHEKELNLDLDEKCFRISFYLKNKSKKIASLLKWSFDYDLDSNKFSNVLN